MSKDYDNGYASGVQSANDTIFDLRAEVERLTKEREDYREKRVTEVENAVRLGLQKAQAEVERMTKERDEAEAWAINLAKIVGGCRNLKTDNPSWSHIKACVMDGIVGRAEAWNRALAAEAEVERLDSLIDCTESGTAEACGECRACLNVKSIAALARVGAAEAARDEAVAALRTLVDFPPHRLSSGEDVGSWHAAWRSALDHGRAVLAKEGK